VGHIFSAVVEVDSGVYKAFEVSVCSVGLRQTYRCVNLLQLLELG